MVEPPFPSESSIIHSLKKDYDIEVAGIEFLPLGADMNAAVYKVRARDDKRYFIKVKHSYNPEISIAITKWLCEAGIQQIIKPIPTIAGQLSQRIDAFTLIVYPFIEGEDGFHRDLTREQWVLLGKTLRQIHGIQLPSSIQNQIRREAYSDTWREQVRSYLNHLDSPPNADEGSQQFLAFMKGNAEIMNRLVDRADELSQQLKNLPTENVLCHADIHGGNVLIDENNTVYIVDWDDPMMAPKERDLMFIGGGVGNLWNKPHEEEWFYQGYGSCEVNRTILTYYRHERIVEDIAQFYMELLSPSTPQTDKQRAYALFTGMFDPIGVVEIAFKSDEESL